MASDVLPGCRCLTCGPAPDAGVRVLVGILSAPKSGAKRRAAIRTSWFRWSTLQSWAGASHQLAPCFVLGSRGLSMRARNGLDGRDTLWLDVDEIGVLSIPKVLAWWRAAAAAMSHFTHAAKVDDDSYVNVPNLLHALEEAHAAKPTALVFGPMAFAGYSPERFRMCGWAWQDLPVNWKRQKCERRGFSPPRKFPLGALQLLSSNIVRALGSAPDVRAFADAANASADLRGRESNEDVALGYWIARVAKQMHLNVTYVSINDRAPNLGCFRNGGLYRQPLPRHIVIHRIKGAAGMGYVWRTVHDGAAHDPVECARQAEIELPKQALVFSPVFQARLKAGTASIHFDQKTNRMQMRFEHAPAGELFRAATRNATATRS